MGDGEFLEQRLETTLAFVAIAHGVFQHGHYVAGDAEATEDGGLLRQVANAELPTLEQGQAGNVLAVEHDLAGIGFDEPHDHGENGGLAGAIGTEQADSLATTHSQRNIANHGTLAETLGKAVGDEPALLVDARACRLRAHCEEKIPVTRPPPELVKVETLVSRFTTSSVASTVPEAFLTFTLPVRRSS